MKQQKLIRLATVVMATFAAFSSVAEEAAAKADAADKTVAKVEDGKKYTPLAEARAKIGDVISDPTLMTEVMKSLSPEDQKVFLADVNAAIAKLPGSTEDKTAKYLNVNRAALKGAAVGNMANVLAVTFATVPPESLTVLSERYAVDLFNRDADPSHKFTDAAFEKTAKEVLGKVEQATTGSDDAGVRNTLAILMFLRASNGSPADLADTLVASLPDSTTRELAKKEWIPAAMAEGENKSYDAMLAYADAGKNPNLDIVLSLAGPQILDAMLVDITSGMDNKFGIQTTPVLDQAFGGFDENMILRQSNMDTTGLANEMADLNARPRTTDPTKPWNPMYKRDQVDRIKPVTPTPTPTPEPEPTPPGPIPPGPKPYPCCCM